MTLGISTLPKIYLFLFLFISNLRVGCSQTVNIVYEQKTNKYHFEELRAFPALEGFKFLSRYTLSISGNKSRFTLDSVIVEYWPEDLTFNMVVHPKNIYKDYQEENQIKQSGRMLSGHGFKQGLYDFKQTWHIEAGTKIIAGLKCQKAVSDKGRIAFFSKDLPFPDGPDKLVLGLPGTVLYYEHERYIYTAVDIYLNDAVIDIPSLTLTTNQSSILLSLDELRALESGNISINKETPKKVWLKF